ncbi:MAG TPA: hypothetical protein VF131_07650 [Blastocatellia bacterium]|nr:hypothetical protein [Blastocatellia bacterium]
MSSEDRRFGLGIWGLAIGYFAFYLPYCMLVKATTKGLIPGVEAPSGLQMLPATGMATAAMMLLIITVMGWWKYSGRRRVFGLSIPCPTRWTLISGVGTAAIIYATTLVYTFQGVSILLAILLLRAGVLLLAPAIDLLFKRRVRWFSWVALGFTLLAVAAAFWDVSIYQMTFAVALTVAVYLAGYTVRIPCMNRLAKSSDSYATYRYFVEEQIVAMAALIAAPAAIALFGNGGIAMEIRHGFSSFFATQAVWPSLLIGALYACLCFFGTLIYLDRRENTFCIPLNRCSSLLSAVAGSYALTLLFAEQPPRTGELVGAVLIIIAILFLSPLHHFRRQLRWIGTLLSESRFVYLGPVKSEPVNMESLRRIFLFVCNGNTSRSPMAQAICTHEIARRLGVSVEELSSQNVRVISAGLTASPGSPMKVQAQSALQQLRFGSNPHNSQSLTADIVEQAERIFCMTGSQRQGVIADFSAPPEKVFLLDPEGDIEEPSEADPDAFLKCANRIWRLVSERLNELGVNGPMPAASATGG